MASMVTSSYEIAEEKKLLANELFSKGQFQEAEALYTEALAVAAENQVVLFTNRAAARLGYKNYQGALEDAQAALQLDSTWLKAYYRKASALEGLNRLDEVFYTWLEAARSCEESAALSKQYRAAEKKWLAVFRGKQFAVKSASDLVERYKLLSEKRERLSTLAHLWNASTKEERLGFFKLLLALIGGQGMNPDQVLQEKEVAAEDMVDMPLDNYPDFPRDRLANWIDYFQSQEAEAKTEIFKTLWSTLKSAEQNDVILDMRIFIAKASEVDGHVSIESPGEDDGEEGIDFSYRKVFGGKKP